MYDAPVLHPKTELKVVPLRVVHTSPHAPGPSPPHQREGTGDGQFVPKSTTHFCAEGWLFTASSSSWFPHTHPKQKDKG